MTGLVDVIHQDLSKIFHRVVVSSRQAAVQGSHWERPLLKFEKTQKFSLNQAVYSFI